VQYNQKELLEEIQRKRALMIDSARRTGFTSDETVAFSQELDQLIYKYQCCLQDFLQEEQEVKIIMKQLMLFWPKTPVHL
jgi:stage 0 sporulation regulatory protein